MAYRTILSSYKQYKDLIKQTILSSPFLNPASARSARPILKSKSVKNRNFFLKQKIIDYENRELPTQVNIIVAINIPKMNIYLKIGFISIFVIISEIAKVESDCIWYGECDVEGDKHRNCPYSGRPKNLTDLTAIKKLSALCPDLIKPTDQNVELCCDKKQIETLQKSMGLPQQLLQRCPACIRNFKQLWCQSTCSPKQSSFMSVVSTKFSNQTKKMYIDHAAYALNYSFFNNLLGSCKRVINPATNKPALDLMCGGKTGDQCTPEAFAKFLGNNDFSPMVLDMDLTNKSSIVVGNNTLHPLNARTVLCSSMTPELDLACSCQDCSQSCPPILPYPDSSEGKCRVGNMECMVFVSSLAFVGLCFLIIVMAVLHYVISQSTQENEDMPSTPIERQGSQDDPHAQYYKNSSGANLVNDSEVTICERMGAWLEANMESACYKWGRMCTRHPALVFLFGLSVSILCSLGIYHLHITTDPVALWSSPSSQGRMEKDYYDQNFGPFYRTAQIIIVPNNQSTFKPSDEKDIIFGPAFRKELLHQLQTSIENLVGEYNGRNVTLKSICVRPLYPDSEECLVQSPLGWFQNSHKNLDKVVEDEETLDSFTYADHLLACIESPTLTNDTKLNMSCLAPYGGPIFPYVAMGNFSSNSCALICYLSE
uniref:Niemann-Pick C1 N-terminal domain-containing protein n=1 Tax=Romanomermis culicivorax TaxID=13658 RepID=A0A915HZA5_ROMCU